MATPTYTLMQSLKDQNDAAAYTVPAMTFTNGRLYLLSIYNSKASAPDAVSSVTHPTIPGIVSWTNGLPADLVYSGSTRRGQLFYGLATSTGSSTTLLTYPATQTGCVADIVEVTGFDSALIDTPATHAVDGVSAGSPGFTITKSLAGGALGSLFVSISYNANDTTHPSPEYGTRLFSGGIGVPIGHLWTGWGTTANPNFQFGGARDVAGFATEILGLGGGTTYNVSVALDAAATVSPSALRDGVNTLALDADAALTLAGTLVMGVVLPLDSDTTVATSGGALLTNSIALDANATVDVTGGLALAASLALDAAATLDLSETVITPGATEVQLQADAALTVAATVVHAPVLALDADAALVLTPEQLLVGAILLDADADLLPSASLIITTEELILSAAAHIMVTLPSSTRTQLRGLRSQGTVRFDTKSHGGVRFALSVEPGER